MKEFNVLLYDWNCNKVMKYITLILTLCLMSCSQPERTPEETAKIIGDNSNPQRFDYDGHKYIRFTWSFGRYNTAGVVHDPDCKCNNDK